jgi:hypothetical protein
MRMEQPRRSKNSVRAIFVVALFITGTVRLAGAQVGDTSYGTGALGKNTTGNDNSAFGSNALLSNTTGGGNTADGSGALESNTFGSGNTADGAAALSNSTGIQNTAIGVEALFSNTAGNQNTAVGAFALGSILPPPSLLPNTGNDNTAIGFSALRGNTTGDFNIAVGFNAGYNLTTGSNNTATGSAALSGSTTGTQNTGNQNTADGSAALSGNTTRNENTADGSTALSGNTTGNQNTADGSAALCANTTGNENTADGSTALCGNSTGSRNIAVGANAGSHLTTGDNNIDIGNPGFTGESNVIRIGTKGVQTRAVIAGISGTPLFVGAPVLVNGNGRLGVPASSARFKRDIHDMAEASAGLFRLRPVSFRYKEDATGARQYGLIAEEVEQVYPELVTHDEHGKIMSVRYDMLPALLLNEVQKLAKEDGQKDVQIAELRKQIVKMRQDQMRIDTVIAARLGTPDQRARPLRSGDLSESRGAIAETAADF